MTSNAIVRLRKRPSNQVRPPFADANANPPLESELLLLLQPVADLRSAARRPRLHNRKKQELLQTSYRRHGNLGAIIVTTDGEIVDGHARFEALKALGVEKILTVVIPDRSPEALTAARLILNRAQEVGVSYDKPILGSDFCQILAVDPTLIASTGFTMAEVDGALFKAIASKAEPPDRPLPIPVTRLDDLWEVGSHRILCGNAREHRAYAKLIGSSRVDMLLSDPPFAVSVKEISKSHGEFVEGSGMSEIEARAFFDEFIEAASAHLKDGAIADLFIDGRSLALLSAALKRAGFSQKAICAWDKQAGGQGSLYRHQIEFVIVSKWGRTAHTNNVQLGKFKRNRTTLWSSPGMAQFGTGRAETLDLHPTVKPIGLLADALLDTSNPGDLILDPFCGTGSTLLACARTGRIGRGIELDPKHVDTALRRLEQEIGQEAVHVESGRTFAETAAAREGEASQPHDADKGRAQS